MDKPIWLDKIFYQTFLKKCEIDPYFWFFIDRTIRTMRFKGRRPNTVESLTFYRDYYNNKPWYFLKDFGLLDFFNYYFYDRFFYDSSYRSAIMEKIGIEDSDWLSYIEQLSKDRDYFRANESTMRELARIFIERAALIIPWIGNLMDILDTGYTDWYFSLINRESIFMGPLFQRLELNPQNFESIAKTSLDDYKQTIESICNEPGNWPKISINTGGWSVQDLKMAIKRVSTTARHPYKSDGELLTYNAPVYSQICSRIPKTIPHEHTLLNSLLYSLLYSSRPPTSSDKIMPGFAPTVFLLRSYYETIYRAFFKTTRYLDWRAIAFNNLISDDAARFVATYDFNINSDIVQDLNAFNIIKLIIAKQESMIKPETYQEYFSNREAILYQPGSLYSQAAPTRNKFLDESSEGIYNTYQEQIYADILQACEHGTMTREIIIKYIEELDIGSYILQKTKELSLNSLSVDKLCEITTNYIKALIKATEVAITL